MASSHSRPRVPRIWWVSLGVLTALGVVVGVVVYVPISHSYAFDTPAGQACGAVFDNTSYPAGAHVSGSWQVVSASFPAEVTIWGSGGAAAQTNPLTTVVYRSSGTNGSFSFTGDGGPYDFEVLPATQQHVGCPVAPAVSVEGSWDATLYQSWAGSAPHA